MIRQLLTAAEAIYPPLYGHRVRLGVRRRPLDARYPYEAETKLLGGLLTPGMLLCDIGANDGLYSFLAEPIVGRGAVYAFEPQPSLAARLRRRGVNAFALALSDRAGTGLLRVPSIGGARYDSRASLEAGAREAGETGHEQIEVELTTLDAFVARHGLTDIGTLKIDVEGHELAVLAGARGTIARDRPTLMVEIEQRHHREPLADLLAPILGLGYAGFFFDAAERSLQPLGSFDVARHQRQASHTTWRYIQNMLFFPNERAAANAERLDATIRAL